MPTVLKSGNLSLLETTGPVQASNGSIPLSNELRRHFGTALKNGKKFRSNVVECCRVYIARRICLGETTFKTATRFKWVHSLEDVLRSFGATLPHLVVALPLPFPFYGQTFRRERKQSVSCCSLERTCFGGAAECLSRRKALSMTEVDKLTITFA